MKIKIRTIAMISISILILTVVASCKKPHEHIDDNNDHICDICDELNITDHTYTNATCTQLATCTKCGETTGTYLPHIFDQEIANEKTLVESATCFSKSKYFKMCVCGEISNDIQETFIYGDMAEHKDDDGDYMCDYDCGTSLCNHIDDIKDHICDICEYENELWHEFNQENKSEEYLVYENGVALRNTYYYSCVCGKKGNEIFLDIPKNIPNGVEIEFWHAMGTSNQALIAKIIDDFEKYYSNMGYHINVTQVSLGDYNTLNNAILSKIKTNEHPTVAQTYPHQVLAYKDLNAIRTLDFYNNSDWGLKDEESKYVDEFLNQCKSYDENGTLYCLPFNKYTEVLYYNKTIFDKYGWEAPQTWDDVIKICEAFTKTSEYQTLKNAGKPVYGFSYDSESTMFTTLTKQWGGEYLGYENTTGNGTLFEDNGYILFDNEQSKEAMKFYYENYKKGYMATSTCFGVSLSSNVFTKGQCIMTVYSNAGARYHMPLDGSFELGIAPCPQKNINDPYAYQYGTDVSLFQCDDPQEELAGWLFLKWLTNYESALIWTTGYDEYTNIDGQFVESAKGTAYFPIRKDVLNSEKYKEYILGKQLAIDGSVVYNPTIHNLACQVAVKQESWLFTIPAFGETDNVKQETKKIVLDLLYTEHGSNEINLVVDDIYNNAIKEITNK